MWAGPPRSDQSGLRKQRTGLRTELDQQGAPEDRAGNFRTRAVQCTSSDRREGHTVVKGDPRGAQFGARA